MPEPGEHTKRFESVRSQIPVSHAQDARQRAELEKETIVVLLEFPGRAGAVFETYEKHNPEAGIRLAHAALQEHYSKNKSLSGIGERVSVLPQSFIDFLTQQPDVLPELQSYLRARALLLNYFEQNKTEGLCQKIQDVPRRIAEELAKDKKLPSELYRNLNEILGQTSQ